MLYYEVLSPLKCTSNGNCLQILMEEINEWSYVRNRQGIGLFFIIIVTLIVIVSFVGLFQMTFARHVVDQVGDVSIGEMALLIAESATAEAAFRVRKLANKPGENAFAAFRQEVYADGSGTFSLDVEIPHTLNLLNKSQYSRFSIDSLDVNVLFQKQFSTVPYEKYGVVNCSATVATRTSLTNKIIRTVNLCLEFKVLLTAPPRPFDQVTFFLVNGTSVVSSANYKIDDTISEYGRIEGDRDEFVSLLEGARGTVPGFDFDGAVGQLRSVNIPSRASIENRIHKFNTPLTIFTVKDNVDLEMVDLPGRLEEADGSIRDAQTLYEKARSALSRNAASESSVSSYVTALRAFVMAYDKNIVAIDEFQDYFAEYSDSARDQLAGFFPKLEEVEWRRKAAWYLSDRKGNIASQLKDLLTQNSPLSGVIFISNSEEALNMEEVAGVTKGNLVIVTTGNVRLSGTGASAPSSLLTIVSYGTVSVEGTCYASIVANNRLSMAPSAKIFGNLIMKDIRNFSGLKGTAQRDSRLHSGRTVPGDPTGAYTDYYYVSISPCETFQIIERK